MLPLHYETRVALNAPVEAEFSYLDDFRQLSAHMEKSSGMMILAAVGGIVDSLRWLGDSVSA